MATSRIEVYKAVNKRVILDLNEIEAKYLHAVLQNCPLGTTPDTEDAIYRESRSAIWCELNNCLEAK